MKTPVSNALAACGLSPVRLHKALQEVVDLQTNEEQTMERYGLRLTRAAEARHALLYRLMEVLDSENDITQGLMNRLRIKGLN